MSLTQFKHWNYYATEPLTVSIDVVSQTAFLNHVKEHQGLGLISIIIVKRARGIEKSKSHNLIYWKHDFMVVNLSERVAHDTTILAEAVKRIEIEDWLIHSRFINRPIIVKLEVLVVHTTSHDVDWRQEMAVNLFLQFVILWEIVFIFEKLKVHIYWLLPVFVIHILDIQF